MRQRPIIRMPIGGGPAMRQVLLQASRDGLGEAFAPECNGPGMR